jgi:arylsulfatase A-like enzyme
MRIFLSCLLLVVARLTAATQPNVIVMLADDAGWGDYSFNGNRQLATPNLDALAKAGAHFDRFFVQPVCSPTRSEFLTGRYHRRLGVTGVSTGHERMNLDEKTFADSFKAAGYITGENIGVDGGMFKVQNAARAAEYAASRGGGK